MRRGLRNNRSFTSTRENGAAAMAIPAPTDIPWLKTGDAMNKAYLEAREEAFRGRTIVVVLPDSGERYLSSVLFEGMFNERGLAAV